MTEKENIKLNVYGTVCPIPSAKTRKMLNSMNSGEILEVEGDFDCALENVVNIAEKNNGIIITQEKQKDFFKVLIQKK